MTPIGGLSSAVSLVLREHERATADQVEKAMVSKCANPACDVKFTYFGTGELLVKMSPATGHQELFWLCQRCATEWRMPMDLIPLSAANPQQQKRKKNAAA
jgi:hypothetical protein